MFVAASVVRKGGRKEGEEKELRGGWEGIYQGGGLPEMGGLHLFFFFFLHAEALAD